MNAPAFDQKTTFPNQDNFNWTLPSEEELKLQIEQLEGGAARRRDNTQKTYCWSRLSHTFLGHNFIRNLVCLALNIVASIHLTLSSGNC